MTKCVVFVCHDKNTFLSIAHHLVHEHVYIIIVGTHNINPGHPRIILAYRLHHNIESEKRLLTFTAWYAIAKNNILEQYDAYCILEYDCIIHDMLWLQNELNSKSEQIISFFKDNNNLFYDINKDYLDRFLLSKKITNTYSSDFEWGCSTNKCIQRDVLLEFVDWYFPYCLYFNIVDTANYSYYHERVFALFIDNRKFSHGYLLHSNIQHQEARSHFIIRSVQVNDFDWEYYVNHNPDILLGRTNLTEDELRATSILHFVRHGHGEGRLYKPVPKKYFLVYDDETGRYDLQGLIESVQKYSSFQIIVFKKSEIDPSFVQAHQHILSLPRGGGYWLWKPYIIHKTLERIEKGSFLFYMDSSYMFKKPFDDLVAYVDRNDVVVWKNKPNEPVYPMKEWCKMDVMNAYNVDGEMEVCWAGTMLLKNTTYSKYLVKKWIDMCCNADHLTDSPSRSPNSPAFIEHRHDQSLLTIALSQFMVPLHFLDASFLHNNRFPGP